MSPDFATKPTLTGERVVLRPFTDDDLAAMAVAIADPDVRRLTGSVTGAAEANAGDPQPDPELREWYTTRNATTDRLDLAIVDRAAGVTVGEVVLNEWDAQQRTCNFRILIGPAGRDRGLGSEATQLILDHAFEVLGLAGVTLTVFAFNPRARRVYEKVGFRVREVETGELVYDGQPIDGIVMEITADDHRARRSAT